MAKEIVVKEVSRIPVSNTNVGRLIGIRADGSEIVVARFEGYVAVSIQKEEEVDE